MFASITCTTTAALLTWENSSGFEFGLEQGVVLEQSYNVAMISSLVTIAFGHRRVLKAFQASTATALEKMGFCECDVLVSKKDSVKMHRQFELVELDKLRSVDLLSSQELQQAAQSLGSKVATADPIKHGFYSLVFTAKATRTGNVGDLTLSRYGPNSADPEPGAKLLLRVMAPIHYFDGSHLAHFVRRALLAISASEGGDPQEARWFVYGLSVKGLNGGPYTSDLPYIFPERHTTEVRYLRWVEELLSRGYTNR